MATDELTAHEISERMGRALRRALRTPPKPHKPKARTASKGRMRKDKSRA